MRNKENAFHLAIPCDGLEAAGDFYVNVPGCLCARKYKDRITLNFFGDQVVCHLAADAIPTNARFLLRFVRSEAGEPA